MNDFILISMLEFDREKRLYFINVLHYLSVAV